MLKFAFRNLLSRPMRALLSLLGLTVAIAGMVGLFSVAEGIDHMVSTTFGRIPGLVAMQPGAPIPLFSNIPADWEEEITQVHGVSVVNAEVWQRANIIDGKMIISPPRFLFGTDIETRLRLQHDPYQQDMVEGRFLTLEDRGTLNTVVSRPIAEEFGKGVGDTLRVNTYDLTIVGIYYAGSLLLDVALILDIDQVRMISRFDPGSVSAYYIETTGEVEDDELAESIQARFRGREAEPWQPPPFDFGEEGIGDDPVSSLVRLLDRTFRSLVLPESESGNDDGVRSSEPSNHSSLPPGTVRSDSLPTRGEEFPIEVRSSAEWAERFDEFSEDLNIFLTLMTGIGVTIAVLSIVNTMLMSVTERIIEFGILKANGWSKMDVLKLITFESAILGVGGGLVGSGVGWTATHVINWYWPERVNLYASPGLLLFALGFSTFLGVLGGLYPAIWAMRMMPMDAIRRG